MTADSEIEKVKCDWVRHVNYLKERNLIIDGTVEIKNCDTLILNIIPITPVKNIDIKFTVRDLKMNKTESIIRCVSEDPVHNGRGLDHDWTIKENFAYCSCGMVVEKVEIKDEQLKK